MVFGLKTVFIKNPKIKSLKISVQPLNFFFVRRNELFFITVDNPEEIAVIFAYFQNIAKIKTKPQFLGNFFHIVFGNGYHPVCQMKIAGSLIIAVAHNQSICCPGIAVLNRFGIFEHQRCRVFIKRIQNTGSIVIIPPLITQMMRDMHNRQCLHFLRQLRTHPLRFNLRFGKILGQAGQRTAVPVIGNQNIGPGNVLNFSFKNFFQQLINRFGKESKTFNFVNSELVHHITAVLGRRIVRMRID